MAGPLKRTFFSVSHVLVASLLWIGLYSANSLAQTEPITRDEIVETAKTGVGHGYKWGSAAWTGFEKHGWCSWTPCSDPDACICIKINKKTGKCANFYTKDAAGADCAGFVSTCWGIQHWRSEAYYEKRHSWRKLPNKKNLKRGDALVHWDKVKKAGHIVLFDEDIGNGKYYAYEAKDCNHGIDRFQRTYQTKYIPIERDNITESACEPDTCHEHGRCAGGTCQCYTGYKGEYCDECENGFDAYGYPNCARSDSTCKPLGSIACNMTPVEISPQDGDNVLTDYCGIPGAGGEMVFRFNPRGTGKATIQLIGNTSNKSIGLMRRACEPQACVARSNMERIDTGKEGPNNTSDDPEGSGSTVEVEQLSFDFIESETFFVVVDSEPGSEGSATLLVDCYYDENRFIGDPCETANDCDFAADPCMGMPSRDRKSKCTFSGTVEKGQCYKTAEGGICTLPCTSTCPERGSLKAPTYCVEDPSDPNTGICVPKSDPLNGYCEDIPGAGPAWFQRFNQEDSKWEEVCYPDAPKKRDCTGSFEGQVANYEYNIPLENATIIASGPIEEPEITPFGEESDYRNIASSLVTDSRGVYSMNDVPCGTYILEFSTNGYEKETARIRILEDSSTKVTRLRALTEEACPETNYLYGLVFKSLTADRDPIKGARVEVWPGLSNDVGGNSDLAEAQSEPRGASNDALSDEDGLFVIPDLAPGNYTVKVTADGYLETLTSVVVCEAVNSNQTEYQAKEIPLTPARMNQDTPFRIVLNWDQPDDLDLHVQLPDGEEIYFYTPCRGDYSLPPYVYLDVDRRAADGAEVMSFKSFLPGRYTVFVHNYSADAAGDGENVADLKESNAEVLVYEAGGKTLIDRFQVPASGTGNTWEVFWFDGSNFNGKRATSTNKIYYDRIQKLTNRPDPETGYQHDCRP